MEPTIRRLGTYSFSVQYGSADPLVLNFQPLAAAAQALHPCRTFVLKHWQARPRGERRFGVFTMNKDGSTSYTAHKECQPSKSLHYDLQVAEGAFVPSAALYYPGCIAFNGVPYPSGL